MPQSSGSQRSPSSAADRPQDYWRLNAYRVNHEPGGDDIAVWGQASEEPRDDLLAITLPAESHDDLDLQLRSIHDPDIGGHVHVIPLRSVIRSLSGKRIQAFGQEGGRLAPDTAIGLGQSFS